MALHRLKGDNATMREYVDVQLDKNEVVFQGSEHEALAVYLSGHLVFQFKEPTAIKYIRLHLSGSRRINLPTRARWKKPSSEDEFYKTSWDFHDAYRTTPEILPAGEHRYPFNVVLEGSMPETVEGLKDASIAYVFTVEIGRKHGRKIRYRRPLRVMRIPSPWDEVWADKIAYRVHLRNQTVPFGSSLVVEYDITPLLSDLRIEYIESQLLEERELTLDKKKPVSDRNVSLATAILASDQHTLDDSTDQAKSTGGYHSRRSLDLPSRLGACVQDTNTMGITVRHQLKINVRMQNPSGQSSELRLRIPVSIYLSPYYRVWEGESFTGEAPPIPAVIDVEEAPPPYGQHQLDRMFDGRQWV
ncbi:hypothetical protein BJX61DRAFT_533036 [Aspergillus egyptiacus]|nr:hypothetical protein BJX61DRAFT_533036 [Aspergillus egyptiacus]